MKKISGKAAGSMPGGAVTMPQVTMLAELRRQRIRSRVRRAGTLKPLRAALTCLLLASHAGVTSLAQGVGGVTFPTVSAEALDKQKVTLPTGLEGQMNLLLLSFAPEQANQVETWTAAAQALQHTIMSFRAYRIPVEDRENFIFRWWANASLRSGETDPEAWHWVIPIYVEKGPLRTALGIADEKSVVALLVDKSGRVLWRATGASSAQSRAGLMLAARGAR